MIRRAAAVALLAAFAFAPAASADSKVVDCALENRIGFPYGGYDVDPVRTVNCIRG
jgi:hypothetical protein